MSQSTGVGSFTTRQYDKMGGDVLDLLAIARHSGILRKCERGEGGRTSVTKHHMYNGVKIYQKRMTFIERPQTSRLNDCKDGLKIGQYLV